jgi:hypothetical protein
MMRGTVESKLGVAFGIGTAARQTWKRRSSSFTLKPANGDADQRGAEFERM